MSAGRKTKGRLMIPVDGSIKPRVYELMCRCVEDGVAYGYRRAHKHAVTPGEDIIREQIEDAVMNSICEYFYFDSDESDS